MISNMSVINNGVVCIKKFVKLGLSNSLFE